ncbi:NAD(P)-dependent dehydrogenase (short-subunit alcohol dehydrogenase family) [Rhodococcus rhodochrous J45]|uniref:NAD(P)-dependent dehydrogenase (Short-subunit alcohol dehydrogenase family) n=1 Tax=Rhodococcus rhodochrous J45 TaxID=935266 RepID=A0A562DN23_RHORH|nr:SDR family oxidoreductase [Rhodococcus rhodochrous]TWH10893.1 NAD(P)-dependent dehydrogenase (short-subunit alcohol dehydrogenase family) [Rhodococcus rhodochrous J45]
MTSTPRILVTGGAAGIGHAIARHADRKGWYVTIIDRDPAPLGRSITADLADPDATQHALEEALSDGPITRLVNNVGAVFPSSLEDQTLGEVEASFHLNLRCAVQCTQSLLPGMKDVGFGRIVNMSSRAALGKELRTAYSAAKAGLIGLTRVWALELGGHGITVNAVGPGPIATDLFLHANPSDSPRTKAIIDSVPVKRLGTPDDVAHAAHFFLGEDSGFVNGQVLYVCGGLTAGLASV